MSGSEKTEGEKRGGGEAGGARLLLLARRELLDNVLPNLEGEPRYRARLIANAMHIAAREIEGGAESATASAADLQAFTTDVLGMPAETLEAARASLRDALREGRLDGNAELFRLLEEVTRRRRDLLA